MNWELLLELIKIYNFFELFGKGERQNEEVIKKFFYL